MGDGAVDTGLSACVAVAIAQDSNGSGALLSLGKRVGFGAVADHSDYAQINPDLIPFFLMHYAIGDAAKVHLLRELRRSALVNVRFAPIILIMPDGPADELIQYIEMGFDDVICLPEKSAILAARFIGQLGQERLFIETDGYLGPDRRRMELSQPDVPGRREGGSSHTRITIIRRSGRGIEVLRRQRVLVSRSETPVAAERANLLYAR